MKRCPHCGVQDHDEAILCKSCMRSFAAPPTPKALGQRVSRPKSLIATAIVRLVLLWTLIYAAVHFDLPSKVIARFNEWQRGQQQEAAEEAPAAAATVAEPPPAAPATSPLQTASVPPEDTRPEPAPAVAEPRARREPAKPSPAPPPAPSSSPLRKTESRAPERPATEPPPPAPAAPAVQPIRVGGNVKAPAKVRDVRPVYPAAAQASRIQGMVIIEATIGVDGRVRETRVLKSVPLLDEAALAAVRQWEYEPTLLNGSPVPVIMTVTVNFRLQ